MTDINPYTPSQTPDPLAAAKVVKRGVGCVVVLILIPLAVMIAGSISCAAATAYFNAVVDQGTSYDPLAVAMVIFLVPPLLVLLFMLAWAAMTFLPWISPSRVAPASGDESPSDARA